MIINELGRSARPHADTRHGAYLGENYLGVRTYLILDQEFDTLDGSSGGLRDGGRDTTHCYHESVADALKCSTQSHHSSTYLTAIMIVGNWRRKTYSRSR
jgi:hypothetical protein